MDILIREVKTNEGRAWRFRGIDHRSPIVALQRGAFVAARTVRPENVFVRWETISEEGYRDAALVTHPRNIKKTKGTA